MKYLQIDIFKTIFDSKRSIHLKKMNDGGHIHYQSILKRNAWWDIKSKINKQTQYPKGLCVIELISMSVCLYYNKSLIPMKCFIFKTSIFKTPLYNDTQNELKKSMCPIYKF